MTKNMYLMQQVRFEILRQTPESVWDGYLEDGYTILEAINEELSYND